MKVIVPVAGYGSRLRPHTFSANKALLHVAGRPILSHVLEPTLALNPDEVIFVIGFRGDEVREYVTSNYSFKSTFVHQDKLLGLGYAVSLGMESMTDGPTLVLLGDTIVELDLQKFVSAGENVLGLREVEDPQRFGIAEVSDSQVLALEEKPANPKGNLAIVGLYYFRDSKPLRSALSQLVTSGQTTRGEIQLTDALQKLILSGQRFTSYQIDAWFDCGKKETVLATNRHLLEKLPQAHAVDGCRIVPPVFVAPDAELSNCTLGPYASISSGAVIRNSTIRHSIVASLARIENATLEHSLVGPRVVVNGFSGQLNVGDSSEVIVS